MVYTYGIKICEDKTVLTHEYNGSYSFFKVYTNNSEEYIEIQSFELTTINSYILAVTDDCRMAILTKRKQPTIPIISFFRSAYGKFILKSEKVYEY